MFTLEQLEQEVARRTGPFFLAYQDTGTPTSSTSASAVIPLLQTDALLGGPENLWLLRRGRAYGHDEAQIHWIGTWGWYTYAINDGVTWETSPGVPHQYVCIVAHQATMISPGPGNDPTHWQLLATWLLPFVVPPADRQRLVHAYDPDAGRIIMDRNWSLPMQSGELAEFSHLDPSQERAAAIRAGLRRCFQEDTLPYVPTSAYYDVDLTAQFPWLTDTDQVVGVNYGWWKPGGGAPFSCYSQAGHVMLSGVYGGYAPTSAFVTALRPSWSWVNGAESTTGPTLDADQLLIDLDYAASAAHIEAWHLFPSRMFAAAAGNLQATQQMAAIEFTRQAFIHGPKESRRIGFEEVVRVAL